MTVRRAAITLTCLTPNVFVAPGVPFTFQFRVANTGDVAFDGVSFTCSPDPSNPGLTITRCPPNLGPLGVAQSVTVEMTVVPSDATNGDQCAILRAIGDAAGLGPECNASDDEHCCLSSGVIPTLGAYGMILLSLCFAGLLIRTRVRGGV